MQSDIISEYVALGNCINIPYYKDMFEDIVNILN